MRTSSIRWASRVAAAASLVAVVSFGGVIGCEAVDEPAILGVDVEPDTFSLDDIDAGNEFRVEADVLYFENPIDNVTAVLFSNNDTRLEDWDLSRVNDIANGERWALIGTLSLFEGYEPGNYYLRVRATDTEGDEAESDRETIVITSGDSD